VPEAVAKNTLVAPYNDLRAVEHLFKKYPGEIAAVIVEPVAANMGVVLPAKGFLEGLRSLTKKHGALLIFDEVITGFRLAYGGAQQALGVAPDLTCLGKIIGGGLPVGAYGGRRDIMEMVAPLGPVYQAGTLSGNPLAMTAGIATLQALKSGSIYVRLEETTSELQEGIAGNIKEAGVSASISRCASMLTLFFTAGPVIDYQSAKKSDTVMFARFFHSLLESGIYWPPAQFEAAFVSAAHNRTHIRSTVKAVQEALLSLKAADAI
jgi:glutamate-1-semialdehyde 2,1-aminomutase